MNNHESRDNLIQQFCDICAIDDRTLARNYLQRFSWDIEEAVQDYLIVRDGTESSAQERLQNAINYVQQQEADASSSTSSSQSLRSRENPPNPQDNQIINRPIGWIEWSWSLVKLPFKFFMVTLYDIWCFIYRTFFEPHRAIADPADDIDKFIASFEAKYGANHPTFYRGSYAQVLADAKRELKFLCIYLHCETHRLTESFCRNTLANQQVIEFLNTRALFWACSVKSREGYRVSQAMHETTYPFVGMICLRENRMMIVARSEGYVDPVEFIRMLNTVAADNEVYLNLARQERINQRENQQLREQQEQAFQESLEHDREKERRKREAEDATRRQAEQAIEEERRQNALRQTLRNRRKILTQKLDAHPEPKTGLRVSIRFSDGCRVERRFEENASLQTLFEFVMCQESCPDNFSIFNTLPRLKLLSAQCLRDEAEELEADLAFGSFSLAGLSGSAALVVQNDDS